MTPYELKILIHYHTRPDAYIDDDAPAYSQAVLKFFAVGLLDMDPTRPVMVSITEKGRRYIETILNTSLKLIDPQPANQVDPEQTNCTGHCGNCKKEKIDPHQIRCESLEREIGDLIRKFCDGDHKNGPHLTVYGCGCSYCEP